MASARELKSRIRSTKDTMKITNAMYMISSSKLRKARKSLADTEPYFYALQDANKRLLRHMPEIEHKYFEPQKKEKEAPSRKVGHLIISADKGLAGAYNSNVLKLAQKQLTTEGEHSLFIVGELGRQYFKRRGITIADHFQYTAQNPTMHRARLIAERLLHLYNAGEINEIDIIFTRMINHLASDAERVQLLPLKREDFKSTEAELSLPREELTLYPNVEEVIEGIVPNYVLGFIYGALVESYSAEQNARMMAMESATKNAGEMLKDLSISYNRVRQSAITQEITEVIGGAKVLKKNRQYE